MQRCELATFLHVAFHKNGSGKPVTIRNNLRQPSHRASLLTTATMKTTTSSLAPAGARPPPTTNTSENILCTLIGDITQHHLWPLLSDNDAISLMLVNHSMCAYYEERVYGLKRGCLYTSDSALTNRLVHILSGPIRIVELTMMKVSLSLYKSLLRARPPLVSLSLGLYRV